MRVAAELGSKKCLSAVLVSGESHKVKKGEVAVLRLEVIRVK